MIDHLSTYACDYQATRDFYSRLNTATLETLTNSDEIREIVSGKDLLRAQPDAPTTQPGPAIALPEGSTRALKRGSGGRQSTMLDAFCSNSGASARRRR